jgi:hypothetical protein
MRSRTHLRHPDVFLPVTPFMALGRFIDEKCVMGTAVLWYYSTCSESSALTYWVPAVIRFCCVFYLF